MILLYLACQAQIHPPYPSPESDPSAAWAELLGEVSSSRGINYTKLRENRDVLDHYVSWIAEHGPRKDRMSIREGKKRLAFLINAYNALVLYSIIEHPELESVQDLSVGLYDEGGAGFFLGQEFKVDGEWVSLFYLEQQYLLGNFQDPLLHAVLNCGSRGCPELRYIKEKGIDKTLVIAMEDFINSPAGAQAPQKKGEPWQVSEIFFWYKKDFIEWSTADNLCNYLRPYATGELSYWLEAEADSPCTLSSFAYDWKLNKATPTGFKSPQKSGLNHNALKRLSGPKQPLNPNKPSEEKESD